jgi:hypothetical protein
LPDACNQLKENEMQPYEEGPFGSDANETTGTRPDRFLIAALIALLGIAGIAATYAFHEHSQVADLTAQASAAKNSTDQLQSQVNALNARLNAISAAPAPEVRPILPSNTDEASDVSPVPAIITAPTPSPSSPIAPTAKPAAPKHAAAKHPSASDKRYTQLKAQLDDQQKQLQQTQDAVAKNRADLEGSINTTKDELNGSIAKNHDELVLLEKRGERAYFEFDLSKSKQFQRVGPMSLSLRKTDTKHKSYDLAMLVDDNELSKKKVNLYEPVWIHLETGGQPVQIVVNRVDKDTVHGYVSAPKYKQSELATASAPSPATAATQPTPQK